MEPANLARAKDLVVRILDVPESDRDRYLTEVCSNDPVLRRQVDELLLRQTQGDSTNAPSDNWQDLTQSSEQVTSLASGWADLPSLDLPSTRFRHAIPPHIGPYSITRELGRGGMGVVYHASDPRLRREIALKILPPRLTGGTERLARFEREAQLLASLNHPNIATIHTFEEFEGVPFLTMELVVGDTLSDRLRHGPLSIADSLSVSHQVALALETAHRRKIVHRDLKPGNIMVTAEGEVKVLDFGLAKALRADVATKEDSVGTSVQGKEEHAHTRGLQGSRDEPGGGPPDVTLDGAILGTPGYMSPEQLQGRSVDHRVDLWALGCMLFECLTGRRCLPMGDPREPDFANSQGPNWSALPAETPGQIRVLLERCLVGNPKERLDSAAEARQVLENAIARGPLNWCFSGYYRGRIARWSAPRHQLDKEFVDLTLLVDEGQESASGRWRPTPERYKELDAVLAAVEDPALVLLGPPGSGKSTLLRRLEMTVAQTALACTGEGPSDSTEEVRRDRVPFYLQLNDYHTPIPGTRPPDPRAWLSDRWQARFPELPPLEALFEAGKVVLLLDGLNEMPMANTAELCNSVLLWKQFLHRLITENPGNRIVFSCRTLDYSAPLSSPTLPVPQIVIEPLNDDEVEQFLIKRSPDRGKSIWKELQGTVQLEVMRSPYFLSLLVHQVETRGEVPNGRAELLTGFVRQGLRREVEQDNPLFAPRTLLDERDVRRITRWSWDAAWELPERGPLVPELSRLAHWMQDRSGMAGESQIRVGLDHALRLLGEERGDRIVQAGVAISVLDEELLRDELLFSHQLLQEYFAGRHFARNLEPERVRSAWRAAEIRPSLSAVLEHLAPSDSLPDLPTTGWEETVLMAAAMAPDADACVRGVMGTHLALAGRCASQPEVRDRLSTGLLDSLRGALLARTQERGADLRARIAAAMALGSLGDPRLERRQGPNGPYLSPQMVEISGGEYPIGEDEPAESGGEKFENIVPRHLVAIATFRIGRNPVTNDEWSRFQESGAYDDERWWDTQAAQSWRSGETTAEGQRLNWMDWREMLCRSPEILEDYRAGGRVSEEVYEAWRRRLEMSDAEFEACVRDRFPGGKLRAPAFWNDERFNHPSQPVVGVSWYEARAYTNWLTAQRGTPYRLPTEAEWEVAARGAEARRYSWGDSFDPLFGNTVATRVRRTTPVGVFLEGMTPEGVCDLTGNVAEWTGSLLESSSDQSQHYLYPYRPADGREDPHAGPNIRRILRGGGWDLVELHARSAVRLSNYPDLRVRDFGFRLASDIPLAAS